MAEANFIDRAIGFLSPKAGADRLVQRQKLEILSAGATRGFDAATGGRRTSDWKTAPGTTDQELRAAGPILRQRARDLDRNDAFASLAATRHADYLVGTGITAKSRTGRKRTDAAVDRLWTAFSRQVDPEGRLNLDGLVHKMVRSMIVDGESFVRRRDRRPSDGLTVPLQIQVLAPEYVDPGKHGPTTGSNQAINGIEFDAIGGRVAYWLFPQNPDAGGALFGMTSSAVPAAEVIHLFEAKGSQTRGSSWLAPIMLDLRDLSDYNAAELTRKKLEACQVGVLTASEDDESPERIVGIDSVDDRDDDYRGVVDGYGDPVERFEPGMFTYAKHGESIQFNSPQASAHLEQFYRSHLRRISAGARIPYELLTNDLSQVTFASGKMGQLAYQRFVRTMQWNLLVPVLCQRIWDWFIEVAITYDLLPDGRYPVEWTTPRFESITPIDDVRADMLEVRSGFASWDEKVTERGYDPDQLLAQIKARNAKFDAAGITADVDPRRVSINGQAQQAEQVGGTNGD